jgi:hypothetical protein
MKFFCVYKNCSYIGKKPFFRHIPLEVLEQNNFGEMFCPHCRSKLVLHQEKDVPLESANS